ncbi:MAG: hypothetical protein P1P88_20800 [Bacteroidales bacterium]|nr:hypothetical protein [Bacteroidales bacterium]
MKKLVLILLFAFIGTYAFSTGDEQDFILTENACFHFKKVRFGFGNHLIGIKANGERQKFLRDEVIQFCKGGFLYEKAPIVKYNKPTGSYDFMRVICRRDEMTLYEYNNEKSCNKDQIRYFVFRKNRFVIELCSHKDANLMAKFISAN